MKLYDFTVNEDLVSIIMPTYNCADYILESIKSVIAQSYSDWELIIVDDCSQDNTKSIVESLAKSDSRIRYFRLNENSGAAVARNTAIKLAKGRWIAFLDSDDLWDRNKLEHQVSFMVQNQYLFTYHEYSEIDELGNSLGVIVSGKKKVNKFDMRCCCWPGCLSVMYDARAIGIIQIESIGKNNDTALWLRIIQKSDCFLLSENLGQYRRRTGSITPSKITTKIKWHYILFRKAEKMNPISACFWMCMNILGNSYKKIFYVKHIR